MSRILLIRHGLTNDGHLKLHGRTPGVRLSAAGHDQARRLAEYLRPVHLEAVYSSPIERCVQTAQMLADGRGVSVRIDQDLQELDWGEWSGKKFCALARDPAWKEFHSARERSEPPQGESLAAVQNRVVKALRQIAEQHCGKVTVVTHADVIKAALFFAMGLSLNKIYHCEINAASVSEIEWTHGCCRVLSMNISVPVR